MISKYVVMHEGDKSLMVLRPYQYYAVEEIIDKGRTPTVMDTSGIQPEPERL